MGSNKKIYTVVIIALLYFAAFLSMGDYNSIGLYVALPCAFIITFISFRAARVNNYFNILIALYFWVFFTALFSSNFESSTLQLKQILGCIIMCYVIGVNARDEKTVPWLYIIYLIAYLVSINYIIENVIDDIVFGEERIGDEKMNANSMAYSTFYLTFIFFIFGEIFKKKWLRNIFRFLFFGIIPLSFWLALVTASRQMMVIQVPLIIILLILRYWKFGNKRSKFALVTALSCMAILAFHFYYSVFEDSLLVERSKNISGDARLVLIEETINMGFRNPIIGVGPGCVQLYTTELTFAHNTYLELFAGTGIIGMILFVILLLKYLVAQYKRYSIYKDKMYLYFAVFGVFYILDQFFYVFYYSLYLISFFILVSTHSETYHQSRKKVPYDVNLIRE